MKYLETCKRGNEKIVFYFHRKKQFEQNNEIKTSVYIKNAIELASLF